MKILNLDSWCDEAKEILREVTVIKESRWAGDQYGGLITSLSKPFRSEHLLMFPKLKFIASCTTGLDHLPLEALKNNGIKIISLQGETAFLQDVHATAEHTFGLILSLVRRIPFAHNDVCKGNWEREAWQGSELFGKTLGIVGMGRVGSHVSKFAKAFGMKVIWCDPYIKQAPPNTIPDYYKVDRTLECLLGESDIVTVHAPLNAETTGMLGLEQFSQMKQGSYFVNTSRGPIVEEGALLTALLEKKIAGAAIDVATGEPDIWEQLRIYAKTQNNLIITPHISGNSVESRKSTQIFISNKIKEYINGL